jgi:hypothetical protein
MPQLEADIWAEKGEDAVPGELTLTVVLRNSGSDEVRLNTHQASHPALVLDVRDKNDVPVLLPPPSAPDAEDLAPGQVVSPGGSITLSYVGFLDRSAPPGEYRARYFGDYPALGGTVDDPLRSGWVTFTVRPVRGFPPGIEIPGLKPNPEDPREVIRPRWQQVLGPIWIYIARWWRWLICLIRRFLGRRCDNVLSQEIDQLRTETISNAPAGSEAWNGTYGWRARFLLTVDEPRCRVTVAIRVRLVGTITAAQRAAWEAAIEAAWNNLFKLCCGGCCCSDGMAIRSDIQFVTSGEHQVVNVGATTTNMGNWGAADTIDVSHEFGHMLGALDEYFTVNGVNWGPGRQATGAIMNNPANPPAGRHYDTVRAAAANLAGSSCSTVAVGRRC